MNSECLLWFYVFISHFALNIRFRSELMSDDPLLVANLERWSAGVDGDVSFALLAADIYSLLCSFNDLVLCSVRFCHRKK